MPGKGTAELRLTALAALAIMVNLLVAVGYVAVHDDASDAAASSAPVSGALPAPTRTAVASILQRRSHAVLDHDRGGFLATIDPSGQAFRAGQEVLFDNLEKVPLASWHESLAEARPTVAADDGWTARLRLSYRLRGFDRREVAYTEYLTFDQRQGVGWVVSGDGAAHGLRDDAQIWNGGTLIVVRGRRSLVLGEGDAGSGQGDQGRRATLRDIARRLDTSVGIVSGIVGDRWARKVVVLAPVTEQKAEELVGDVRNLGDIAALATITGNGGSPSAGEERVVISPTAFGRLNALGRHVVLTHELLHVAMGGARDSHTPMWLIEGLADYAGYKNAGVSTGAAGSELAEMVRAGDPPVKLPDREDFAGSGDHLSAAYEGAWLACRMIAERWGEAALVRLYRTARAEPGDTGDPRIQDHALHSVLGIGSAEFAARWRAYVREQLE